MVYLKIKKGMSVVFSITPHDGTQQHLILGRSLFDLVHEIPKVYLINTTEIAGEIGNKTVELVFDFYSGNP